MTNPYQAIDAELVPRSPQKATRRVSWGCGCYIVTVIAVLFFVGGVAVGYLWAEFDKSRFLDQHPELDKAYREAIHGQ